MGQSPESVHNRWWPSLDFILGDNELNKALVQFCEMRYCPENAAFFMSVKELHEMKDEKDIDRQCLYIFDTFIKPDAEAHINIGYMQAKKVLRGRAKFEEGADDEKMTIETKKKEFDDLRDELEYHRCLFPHHGELNFYQMDLFIDTVYDWNKSKGAYKMKRKYREPSKNPNLRSVRSPNAMQPPLGGTGKAKASMKPNSKPKSESRPENRNKKGDSKHHSSRK